MSPVQPLHLSDAYKLSHKGFMDAGTEYIYSNFTPRTLKHFPVPASKRDDAAVLFGLQYFIKKVLIESWNEGFFKLPKETVIKKFKRRCDTYLGKDSVSMSHFEDLHDLGFLPILIKALPEGSLVPSKVPFLTITNTDPKFAWLTNYLETVLSCSLWKPCYTATLVREYKKLVNKYADETVGNRNHTVFSLHGFEFRGMSGVEDAAISGAGLLLSSYGTDTIVSIDLLEDYYNADAEKELVACSIPASEHSCASLGTSMDGELEFFRRCITEFYPRGLVSLVSDTYDLFQVLSEFTVRLKDDILNRQPNELGLAKTIFRPDSGNPVDIICGIDIPEMANGGSIKDTIEEAADYFVEKLTKETGHGERGANHLTEYFKWNGKVYILIIDVEWNRHDKIYYYIDGYNVKRCEETILTPEQKGAVECLWDVFGGTISDKGYKVLHERVGLVYGDSCTYSVIESVLERLKRKGFASNNIVFGIGSYSMTYATRDSIGGAQKATWAQVRSTGYDLFKTPKTDVGGMKKSAKGLLRVDKIDGVYTLRDQCTPEEEAGGELRPVFRDGKLLIDDTLSNIRARVAESL